MTDEQKEKSEEAPSILNLKYSIVSFSSEDREFPITEISKGQNSKGWQSRRFCLFPQEIILRFNYPVNIKQINILFHETKIPSIVEFYSLIPTVKFYNEKCLFSSNFQKLGYIKVTDNRRSYFKARELRKIQINENSYYFKLVLHKYHNNYFNIFGQVGIISLEFYGYYYYEKIKSLSVIKNCENEVSKIEEKDNERENFTNLVLHQNEYYIPDDEFDKDTLEKINSYKEKLKELIQKEDYSECNNIKKLLTQVRLIGKKIYILNRKKISAVKHEIFEEAKELKEKIEKTKEFLSSEDKILKYSYEPEEAFKVKPNTKFNNIILNTNDINYINQDDKSIEDKSIKFENSVDFSFHNDSSAGEFLNHQNKFSESMGYPNIKNPLNQNIKNNSNANSFNNSMYNKFSQGHNLQKVNIINPNNSMSQNTNVNKIADNMGMSIPSPPKNKKIKEEEKKLQASKSQPLLDIDNNPSYDDLILPALRKKMFHESLNNSKEKIEGSPEISPKRETNENNETNIETERKLDSNHDFLVEYIGEEGYKKLISKQVPLREQGLNLIIDSMDKIFDSQIGLDIINKRIVFFFSFLLDFLEETHPVTVSKTFEIFKKLLTIIKELGETTKTEFHFAINDRIFKKLKEKLGDVSKKVRNNAEDLYLSILKMNFCDYNQILIKLIREELPSYLPSEEKKTIISKSLILGKLNIFSQVIDDLDNAISELRTDMKTFPYKLLCDYFMLYICHPKDEVRRIDHICINKIIERFGNTYIKQKLRLIDVKYLRQIVDEIPILTKLIPELENPISLSPPKKLIKSESMASIRRGSGENSEKKKKLAPIKGMTKSMSQKDISSDSNTVCDRHCEFCNKPLKRDQVKEHYEMECPVFVTCSKCKSNLFVKDYIEHLLLECRYKKFFKQCKRCKEPIDIDEYNTHIKKNDCNPAKNKSNLARCPLCHCDIDAGDQGFIKHLVAMGCSKQTRKNKN